jgi:hypothetical protein
MFAASGVRLRYNWKSSGFRDPESLHMFINYFWSVYMLQNKVKR